MISENWQPEKNWIRLCKQHSIPEKFVRDLIPEFVNYWRDRGQSRFSWGNAFYKHVIREWREEQTRNGKNDLLTTMSSQWKPSPMPLKFWKNQVLLTVLLRMLSLSLSFTGEKEE